MRPCDVASVRGCAVPARRACRSRVFTDLVTGGDAGALRRTSSDRPVAARSSLVRGSTDPGSRTALTLGRKANLQHADANGAFSRRAITQGHRSNPALPHTRVPTAGHAALPLPSSSPSPSPALGRKPPPPPATNGKAMWNSLALPPRGASKNATNRAPPTSATAPPQRPVRTTTLPLRTPVSINPVAAHSAPSRNDSNGSLQSTHSTGSGEALPAR